jgi:hypothetical protein
MKWENVMMTASDRELERRHRAENVGEHFNTCRSKEWGKKAEWGSQQNSRKSS